MKRVIPIAGPSITSKEIDYVTDAVTNGWYENANDYIIKFENAFKKYLGRQYAISLPSCTSGLHLSLLALGVGDGDEVIIPDATWIASAAPINYVGAIPVLVDISSESWCISAQSVEAAITPKTKAIIAVNLYGHMPDYEALDDISKRYNIPIIEDAAESIGSEYKGRLSGSIGMTSCFSFHGSKTLTTGEGGMLVTDDKEVYDKCMMLRDHGRNPGDVLFQNIMVGHKYKMSALQAALGLAQLERVDELVTKKRQIFKWYKEAFDGVLGVSLNPDQEGVYNSYWMSTLLFDNAIYNITKEQLIEELKEQGIDTRPFFYPLSSLKAYSALENMHYDKRNINSYHVSSRGLNLPSSLSLNKEDIYQVKDVVVNVLKKSKY